MLLGLNDFTLQLVLNTASTSSMTTTLLIVDDSEATRRKYWSYLTSVRPYKYLTLEADTLEKAKALYQDKQPDMVLLGWQLVDGDGAEFINWIEQQEQTRLLPILLIANQNDESMAVQITQQGIQDYLIKEYVTPERLGRSLDHLLERVKLMNAVADAVKLRKRAEEHKLEHEAKFLSLVQCLDDLIWTSDLKGNFIYLSPQFHELFGWETNDWLGKSIVNLVHNGDRHRFTEHIENILTFDRHAEMPVEFRHLQKDGSYVWVSGHMTAMRNAQGDVIAVQGICRDISDRIALAYAIRERRLIETRLHESNEALANVNQELIRAAQQKKEFLSDISHKLRTSLNIILGSIECLQDGVYGNLNEKQRDVLQTIESSENHLLELINQVVEFSKSE